MLLTDAIPCLFCLNPSSSRLGLDRKTRPYVHCACCGARSFLPSFSPCLHGLPLLGPLALAIHEEMSRDREAWERRSTQIAGYLAALRAQFVAAGAAKENGTTKDAAPGVLMPINRSLASFPFSKRYPCARWRINSALES